MQGRIGVGELPEVEVPPHRRGGHPLEPLHLLELGRGQTVGVLQDSRLRAILMIPLEGAEDEQLVTADRPAQARAPLPLLQVLLRSAGDGRGLGLVLLAPLEGPARRQCS